MPNLDAILSSGSAIDAGGRAALAWRRIQDKPSSITILRVGTAQTVRIEFSETVRESMDISGTGSYRDVVVFGVRDHSDVSVTDTDILARDRFVLNNVEYQVMDVVTTLGEVQARCEAIS